MKITYLLLILGITVGTTNSSFAAVKTWDNGVGDTLWTSGDNWDPSGAPNNGDTIIVGANPSFDIISVDAGSVQIASFTTNSGVSAFSVDPLSGDTLQVNGAITNNSSNTTSFSIGVIAGASAIWSGNLNFAGSVNIFADVTPFTITLGSGNISFTNQINLRVFGSSSYSIFNISGGSVAFTGTINLAGGTYASVLNESYDFTNGNFTGATLGSLPALADGVNTQWDTSNFLANGTITVVAVPEPTTWALLAGSLTTVMIFRRRRS